MNFFMRICLFSAISILASTTAYCESIKDPMDLSFQEIVEQYYADQPVYIGGTSSLKKRSFTSGLLNKEFNYITPENDFKHQMVHPRPGVWKWDAADAWIENAVKYNQLVRLHGPISPQCSTWAKQDDRTAQELLISMVDFMTAQCKRYNDVPQVKWMDVVNETIDKDSYDWFGPKPGTDRWENPWTTIGFDKTHPLEPPLYIGFAFHIANRFAPNIDLIINQHGSVSPKLWDKIFALVDYLRQHKGLRVDGIGWQAHVDLAWEKTGDNLTDLADLIDRAHAKNLSFHITENNVWLKRKKDYEGQAETFAAILRVLLSKRSSGEVSWNVWNLSDADSWANMREFDGCIFDYDYQPKPAYFALKKVLIESATND